MLKALELNTIEEIKGRKLSFIEYYHACIGQSSKTLERNRECVIILEGRLSTASFDRQQWEHALHQAAEANPGARLQMRGRCLSSQWHSDGALPAIRHIKDCSWRGFSSEGSEFIVEQDLCLREGPSVELILVEGDHSFVILRALHAVMDGLGLMHFFQEIFRALQGESLLGTNSLLSDVELARTISQAKRETFRGAPPLITGGARGLKVGDCWESIRFHGNQKQLLVKTILATAEVAAKYSEKPARIALPISLRRHVTGILSTMNYTSMVHFDVDRDDDNVSVKNKIKAILSNNAEADIPRFFACFKLLPLHWLDRMVSRSASNYCQRGGIETAVISNLGHYRRETLSGGGFSTEYLFTVPIAGNTMLSIVSLDDDVCITVGTENIFASDGRLEDLVSLLSKRLIVD